MLASDLDGTLLRSDGSVSEETRRALAAAERAGLIVAFVTGRPPRWLHEVADATGHTGIAVGANGAITYDLHTETVLDIQVIDSALLERVTGLLRERIPDVSFGFEQGLDFAYEPSYRHDWDITPATDRNGRPLPQAVVAELPELLQAPSTIKLLAKGRGLVPDDFMDAVEDCVGDLVTVTRSGHSPLVEISARGVTKASGLAVLAACRGVEQDAVAAVGDMPNDVPMLLWAGHSYAVANAHPAAKQAAATVLAETNDDHAVARLIHDLLRDPLGDPGRTASA
jgi:Cof subfamily protein (haloacid dehalogenase superfamily)